MNAYTRSIVGGVLRASGLVLVYVEGGWLAACGVFVVVAGNNLARTGKP